MKSTVECRVCHGEVSLWSWLRAPVSFRSDDSWLLRCSHCGSRWRRVERRRGWVPRVVTALLAVLLAWGMWQAMDLLRRAAGDLVLLPAWSVFVCIVFRVGTARTRREYERGELELIEGDGTAAAEPPPTARVCRNCGRSDLLSRGCCPMCGAELRIVLSPIVCPACGEQVRLAEVCCPACRTPIGSGADR